VGTPPTAALLAAGGNETATGVPTGLMLKSVLMAALLALLESNPNPSSSAI
jgi:hypothetical protein